MNYFVLQVLKFAGILLSGIFGIAGQLHDFKTKDGTISRWGRINLVGLIASLILTLSTFIVGQLVDNDKATRAAQRAAEAAEQTMVIVTNLNRLLAPLQIESIRIKYRISGLAVLKYKRQLIRDAKLHQPVPFAVPASLAPTLTKDREAYQLLTSPTSIIVNIYREHLHRSSSLSPDMDELTTLPDISIKAFDAGSFSTMRRQLTFEPLNEAFEIDSGNISSNNESQRSLMTVRSLGDLAGGCIIVKIRKNAVPVHLMPEDYSLKPISIDFFLNGNRVLRVRRLTCYPRWCVALLPLDETELLKRVNAQSASTLLDSIMSGSSTR